MPGAALNNLVVVSDIHAGCRLALCGPEKIRLDDGGTYEPSPLQLKLWDMWQFFWNEWVPEATRGEPYGIVINGDAVEGNHHRSVTQISHNPEDQRRIAVNLLKPIVERLNKRFGKNKFWMVRGTEAHVGSSANDEENIAKTLGAVPNAEGQYARWDLWKKIGPNKLVHLLHHISTTGSQAYEATAVGKELVEEFTESARWWDDIPDVSVRSHRHRYIKVTMPTKKGESTSVVTPCWQGKTPFTWRIPGARLSTPQFGGILIRYAHDRIFVDSKVWTVERSAVE